MTPIVLSASVTLAAGASGIPNLQKLVPPMNRPMLVQDISFTIQTPSATALVDTGSDLQFGSIIRARILAGRHAVTDGFVPLCNFAPLYSRNYDRNNPFFNNVLTDALVAAQGEFYNHWRWVLPKPMYVAPGEGIQPIFQRSTIYDALLAAGIVAGSFTVRINVHGTLLYRPQKGMRDIPYVTCFTPTALEAANAFLRSNEKDLNNSLSTTVYVQRFVGHMTQVSSTLLVPSTGADSKIEMADTKGYDVTHGEASNLVAWNSLFPEQRKSWTFNSRLDPNEKFTIGILNGTTENVLHTVSFVGHREEAID